VVIITRRGFTIMMMISTSSTTINNARSAQPDRALFAALAKFD